MAMRGWERRRSIKVLLALRRFTRRHARGFPLRLLNYFNWGGLLSILAILGLYLGPLVTREKGFYDPASPMGILLYGYFDVLGGFFGDQALIVHFLACTVLVFILNALRFMNRIIDSDRFKSGRHG